MRQELTLLQPVLNAALFGQADFTVHYAAYVQETANELAAGTLVDTTLDPSGKLTLLPSGPYNTINWAAGKSVTGDVSGSNLARVTDGSTTSGYVTLNPDGVAHYVQVDLGEELSLGRIHMWHYFGDPRKYHGNTLELSTDGTTWVTVFDSAVDGEYTETSAGKSVEFTATNARYIRNWLNGSTSNPGSHWVELEAYSPAPTYALTGSRKSTGYLLSGMATADSVVTWQVELPTGTNVVLKTALTDSDTAPLDDAYTEVSQGSMPAGMTVDMDLTGKYLWLWATLSTTNNLVTPRLAQVDVGVLVGSAAPVRLQCVLDRVWVDGLPTPERMTSELSPPMLPNTTHTWTLSLAHGYWYWQVQSGAFASALGLVHAGPPQKRVLYQYTNRAKYGPDWTHKRVLYQYTNRAKALPSLQARGWYQYDNITADPPFPWVSHVSAVRGPAGSIVTLYGNGFGFQNTPVDLSNPDRALRCYGGQVFIGEMTCGILYWSWQEIRIQIPMEAESGPVRVVLTALTTRSSIPIGFEVYQGIPADDIGIELFVCDRLNPNTILAQLTGATSKAFQILQNNPGSGSFRVPRLDPVAGDPSLLTEGAWILVRLDGQDLFKWMVESKNPTYVDSGEDPMIEVSGRGALAQLAWAVVYPESMGSPVLDRPFSGTPSTILRTLIREAQTRGGLQSIQLGWADDEDSLGNVFTESVSLSFHVGTPILEVLTKFTEGLGFFDVELTPNLVLKIYRSRGSDLSDRIVYRPGQAILTHQNQSDASRLVNEVLVEGGDKRLAIATHPSSTNQYGRREGYLSANSVTSGLAEYGMAYLQRVALPTWGIQATITQFYDEAGARLKPFSSYLIGDWIGWQIPPEGPDPIGFQGVVRVKGVTVKESDDTGALVYSLELNNTMLEHEIRLSQKVERLSQFSGTDVLSIAPSSSSGYTPAEVDSLVSGKAEATHTHSILQLIDTPDSYLGQSGKVLVVNPEANGLAFQYIEGGGSASTAINPADIPPAVSHLMDDEFFDETMDAKWIWVNQGTSAWTENGRYGAIDLTSGSDHMRLLVQTAPVGDFTATAKVIILGPRLNYFNFGLCLYNSATGRRVVWGKCCRSGYSGMQAIRFTSNTSYSSDPYLQGGWDSSFVYVRIRKAGTTLYFDMSIDGEFWWTSFSEAITAFLATVSHVGLGYFRNNTNGITYRGACEWFRVTEL